MVITFIKEKSKRRYIFIGLLVVGVVVIIAGGFALGLFQQVPLELFGPVVLIPKIEIDFEILKHSIFEELGEPGEPLEVPEQVGRENPFQSAESAPAEPEG